MDYKDIKISDIITDYDTEDFKKVAKVVEIIGQTYPAISIDILARIIITVFLQYELSKDNQDEFIRCLSQYVEVSEGFDFHKSKPKTIH